jgi:DNA-directed RNA polymerase specialized sigma24 family protein
MTANSALREDLLQEALIHLWLAETRRPGQTKSWYLQSCKYHLLHYLASGRSVDSAKRRGGQLEVGHDSEERDVLLDLSDHGDSVFTWVSARDIISLLTPQLLPRERAVLGCFADGLGPREIGRKLRMSHTMVIKHRRKIASLFHRLEVPALPKLHLNGNGTSSSNGHSSANGNGHRANGLIPVARLQSQNGHHHPNGHLNPIIRLNGHARQADSGLTGNRAPRALKRLAASA